MQTFGLAFVFAGHVSSAAIDNSRALWNKAKEAFRRHDYKAFIEYEDALLKADSEGAWQIYYGRGVAYAKLSRHEDAIADFNKVVLLNSHFAPAFIDRGLSYYNKGSFQQALIDFNRAIEIDPKDARAYRDRADLEDEMYLKDEALRDYDTALRLKPHYEDALYNRGNH